MFTLDIHHHHTTITGKNHLQQPTLNIHNIIILINHVSIITTISSHLIFSLLLTCKSTIKPPLFISRNSNKLYSHKLFQFQQALCSTTIITHHPTILSSTTTITHHPTILPSNHKKTTHILPQNRPDYDNQTGLISPTKHQSKPP